MTNPTPSAQSGEARSIVEKFYAYCTEHKIPKKGELRRVLIQLLDTNMKDSPSPEKGSKLEQNHMEEMLDAQYPEEWREEKIEALLEKMKPYYKHGFDVTRLVMCIRSLQSTLSQREEELKRAREALERQRRWIQDGLVPDGRISKDILSIPLKDIEVTLSSLSPSGESPATL